MPRLRGRTERFCLAYLDCANAAEAARRAGYSARWAKGQGYRLLHRPAVATRLAELRAELAARDCLTLDSLLAKLESAYVRALEAGQTFSAARIVDAQAKLPHLFAKLRKGEELPPGAEPTRAALARMARQLGVAPPKDA